MMSLGATFLYFKAIFSMGGSIQHVVTQEIFQRLDKF